MVEEKQERGGVFYPPPPDKIGLKSSFLPLLKGQVTRLSVWALVLVKELQSKTETFA